MTETPGPTPAGNRSPAQREVTYIESDDEIRQAIQARQSARQANATRRPAADTTPVGSGATHPPEVTALPLDAQTQAEKPVERPPLALLYVLDDGKATGELVRIRSDRMVIGRSEGDICIPNDLMISSRHAEITRSFTSAGWVWLLSDLKSTNGTFVRVGKIVLRDQKEFIIGRGRYRFESGVKAAALSSVNSPAPVPESTMAWSGELVGEALVPRLVELTPAGVVKRVPLVLPEYWIGRDSQTCAIVRADDLLVNARHARLSRDQRGQWILQNNKSLNGVWERVFESLQLTSGCRFRLGEQLFQFQVL
jgi:pSer/pThr/pTyr-binding forkhead associated (FHA) protein